MAFAIAHVRGGGELGEAWYRAGKQENKHNTFSDFIACAIHSIDNDIKLNRALWVMAETLLESLR